MRSIRHEFLSAALALCLPTAVCLSFPFESLRFKARSVSSACEASAAFVMLSPEAEASALLAAKTAWQSERSAGRRMRFRLPLGELPDDLDGTPIEVRTVPPVPETPMPLGYSAPAWAPSQGASAPIRIKPTAEAGVRPAFSREELLQLN